MKFPIDNGSKHVVNVYDYYYDTDNILCFKIYDNNYPFSCISSNINQFDSFVLKIYAIYDEQNIPKTFQYAYIPDVSNSDYKATSVCGFEGKFCMAVIDDQWNILNDAT